jgi:hypothetical protein
MKPGSLAAACVALCAGVAAPEAAAQQRSLALTSGDFDEDGAPDLITASRAPDGGFLRVRKGRPGSPARHDFGRRTQGTSVTSSVFLPAARSGLPFAPDLLGTGDFDGDGRLDVVAASVGSDSLYWLFGDGKGRFGSAVRACLPGT